MLDMRPYLRRPLPALVSVVSNPLEALIRFSEQFAAHQEERTPADLYQTDNDWEARLQGTFVDAALAPFVAEFWELWPQVIAEMEATGVKAGPESFKGWNDGDAAFVRAIWCLIRHLRVSEVVETGVAHGVTSRFILEAFERNGRGHLWSIDRPPMEPEWRKHVGIAVPDRLKFRWCYIDGSSRRRLPSLLSKLGKIDLFIHDSLHSEHNVRFEMDRAWGALRPNGALVVDDIDVNRGFDSFTKGMPSCCSIVCEAEPLRPDGRRFNKKGLFGIVVKASHRRNSDELRVAETVGPKGKAS